MTLMATIPSPTRNQIDLFGLPLRAYALCILAGIVLAIWLSSRRWLARGGKQGEILDLALWAVPFGIIGGRLYHVLSSPSAYFGENGDPIKALYIWEGGLGIWGAIAFGALGAWIGARRMGLRMSSIADTLAPGLIFAQAIGRLGNWFNNELYGGESDGWLALEIHELDASGNAYIDPATGAANVVGTFQPTFLYELVWNTLLGVALLWLDKRFRMGRGRVFAAYVGLYCFGRFFIEQMRTDPAELILGQRINVWTALLVGLGAAAYLILVKGTREATPYTDDRPAFVDAEGEPTGYKPPLAEHAPDETDITDETDRAAEIDQLDDPAKHEK
ncbi:prolipoprotein diacylglyceryl transferase family protein [Cumulibacter manganitolerans]|uniref:prolipoprotein diacylglyceryl transferase family protein n=1 Tax=Cumulibacter manganitolerans TaxID=1884992 RepID=UPI001296D915|nr:prolipoprotein diacylglyceryl transferase family protein [Cumulibacter manganitolerans]